MHYLLTLTVTDLKAHIPQYLNKDTCITIILKLYRHRQQSGLS